MFSGKLIEHPNLTHLYFCGKYIDIFNTFPKSYLEKSLGIQIWKQGDVHKSVLNEWSKVSAWSGLIYEFDKNESSDGVFDIGNFIIQLTVNENEEIKMTLLDNLHVYHTIHFSANRKGKIFLTGDFSDLLHYCTICLYLMKCLVILK